MRKSLVCQSESRKYSEGEIKESSVLEGEDGKNEVVRTKLIGVSQHYLNCSIARQTLTLLSRWQYH
jgi:hypothetical protein